MFIGNKSRRTAKLALAPASRASISRPSTWWFSAVGTQSTYVKPASTWSFSFTTTCIEGVYSSVGTDSWKLYSQNHDNCIPWCKINTLPRRRSRTIESTNNCRACWRFINNLLLVGSTKVLLIQIVASIWGLTKSLFSSRPLFDKPPKQLHP